MAADVCLLLMQSLSGECNAELPKIDISVPQVEEQARTMEREVVEPRADAEIAPTASEAAPQFSHLCIEETEHQLVDCVLPSETQPSRTVSNPTPSLSTALTMQAASASSPPPPLRPPLRQW